MNAVAERAVGLLEGHHGALERRGRLRLHAVFPAHRCRRRRAVELDADGAVALCYTIRGEREALREFALAAVAWFRAAARAGVTASAGVARGTRVAARARITRGTARGARGARVSAVHGCAGRASAARFARVPRAATGRLALSPAPGTAANTVCAGIAGSAARALSARAGRIVGVVVARAPRNGYERRREHQEGKGSKPSNLHGFGRKLQAALLVGQVGCCPKQVRTDSWPTNGSVAPSMRTIESVEARVSRSERSRRPEREGGAHGRRATRARSRRRTPARTLPGDARALPRPRRSRPLPAGHRRRARRPLRARS